jgi:HAMP domain
MTERARLEGAAGAWSESVDWLNWLIDNLVRPTTEVARVIGAVADGDLSQKMALKIGGQPVRGEFLSIGTTVNTKVDQLWRLPTRSPALRERSGRRASWAGRPRCRECPAPGVD